MPGSMFPQPFICQPRLAITRSCTFHFHFPFFSFHFFLWSLSFSYSNFSCYAFPLLLYLVAVIFLLKLFHMKLHTRLDVYGCQEVAYFHFFFYFFYPSPSCFQSVLWVKPQGHFGKTGLWEIKLITF